MTGYISKKLNIITLLIPVLCIFSGCSDRMLPANDSRLSEKGGLKYLNGNPYTGEIVTFFDGGLPESSVEYRDGKKDGTEKIWYKNGKLLAERKYSDGKREGIHKGWHTDGEIRFYFSFKDDRFEGENWTWYPNGQTETYSKFENGIQLGYKHWRSDGKIYMNYVMDGFERIGMYGSRLCRKAENEKDGKTVSD